MDAGRGRGENQAWVRWALGFGHSDGEKRRHARVEEVDVAELLDLLGVDMQDALLEVQAGEDGLVVGAVAVGFLVECKADAFAAAAAAG